jgi:mRNA-degrading endonuclease RelE of RelBE toxin-antitoxin system
LAEKFNLSVTCNTDGAVVFNSVKNTLYPIHLRINEFPPQLRFNQGNSLLAGLYFGKKEPDMSLFLAPFVKEMKELYDTGFEWCPKPDIKIVSRVVLLQCVLDSVAKPKVQNINQFNGYWSCGYCLHPGVVLDYVPSNQSKFLMNNDVHIFNDLSLSYTVTKSVGSAGELKTFHVTDRNNTTIRKDMDEADKVRQRTQAKLKDSINVRGMKGNSVFNRVPSFDASFGYAIDYMHSVLLGNCRSLALLWFDKDSPFYIGDEKLAAIEKRLSTIAPPSCISRRPRPLSEMMHWKANEWRAWLLYYSLPCLIGNIPLPFLKHYCLLVTSLFILLGDLVSKDDVRNASWYLVQFVVNYSNLYGEPNVFYNVHLLLHLGKMVLLYGPLWCYSAFSFESANGSLIKLVKGTMSVASQIVLKYSMCKLLPQTITLYHLKDSILEFCEELLCYRTSQAATKVGTVTVIGTQVEAILKNYEAEAFRRAGKEICKFSYQRFLKKGVMYHARCYSRRGEKSDDSVIRLHSGRYGVIYRILIEQDGIRQKAIKVLVRLLNIERNRYITAYGQAKAQHIKCCSAVLFGDMTFVDAEDIATKAIILNCGDDSFITDFPNFFEKD